MSNFAYDTIFVAFDSKVILCKVHCICIVVNVCVFFPGMERYDILSVLLLHIDYVLNSCENSLLLPAIIFV